MASVAIPPLHGARDSTTGLDKLPEEMNDMKLRDDKVSFSLPCYILILLYSFLFF